MNITGNNIKLEIFGASHDPCVGGILYNLPKGLKIDIEQINLFLKLRNPNTNWTTARKEEDKVIFDSGIKNGLTDGNPLKFHVDNKNINDKDYTYGICRPGHADYVSYVKYGDNYKYQGGGMSSGRTSVVLVIAGSICKQILPDDILVASQIKQIDNLIDSDIKDYNNALEVVNKIFPTVDEKIGYDMINLICKVKEEKDSIGGIIQTFIYNLPVGIGEPYFDSLESKISSLLFSIGGIKGVLFGDGIDFVNTRGSKCLDTLQFKDNEVVMSANHNGGINGGISNGNIVKFQTIVKPTSTIEQEIDTINYVTKENVKVTVTGRHDPAIVSRISVIINSICYIALSDLYIDYLTK